MTIVVTTASIQGISVVGDRAQSRAIGDGQWMAESDASKVFFSAAANVGFALWGDARWPASLGDYWKWFDAAIVKNLTKAMPLKSVCEHVCAEINPILVELGGDYDELRRGIHVAGYVEGRPHIYHCHTGHRPPESQHELQIHYDWPTEYCPDEVAYLTRLKNGPLPQIRNGRYDLFVVTRNALEELISKFQAEYKAPLPKRDLKSQLLFDVALVRFASGVMQAAGFAATVSDNVEGFAFDEDGHKEAFPQLVVSMGDYLPPSISLATSGDRQPPHTSSAADYLLPGEPSLDPKQPAKPKSDAV